MCKSHITSSQVVELIFNIILISVIRQDVDLTVSRKLLSIVIYKVLPELCDLKCKVVGKAALAQVRIVFNHKTCSLKNKLFV